MANDTQSYSGNNTVKETVKGPFKGALRGGALGIVAALAICAAPAVIAGFTGASAVAVALWGIAGAVGAIFAVPLIGGIGAGYGAIKGPQNGYNTGRQIDGIQNIVSQKSNELESLNQRIEAEISQPRRTTAYAQAPVFVMPGECPHCKVSNMNYQGQAVALQPSLAVG